MSEPGAPLAAILPSWLYSLDGRQLSPRTIEIHKRTITALAAYLKAEGFPDDTEGVDAPHLRAFLAYEAGRTSAISAHQHYRNLCVLFKWLIKEQERIGPNPMERVDPPKVTTKVKPILAGSQLAALLKTCEGNGFEQRRDMAIVRVFIDTGVRVSGLAGVKLADVNLGGKAIKVTLKSGDEHLAPIGRQAAAAIDRYIRGRAPHPRAQESDWLWLGLTRTDTTHFGLAGVQDLIERRGKLIGIPNLTPPCLRPTFAPD